VVVLLSGAGLLTRSYLNVISVDTGFSQSTLTMSIELGKRYRDPQADRATYFKLILARIAKLPGVLAVGAVSDLPLAKSESLSSFEVDGFANQKGQAVEARAVTPGYFEAMQIPLVGGRYFTDRDESKTTRLAIINERFAKVYFAGGNAIGGRIYGDEKRADWATIIGIVDDVRHTSLEEDPQPQMYTLSYADVRENSLAIRAALPAATVTKEIRSTLNSIDPGLALTDIRTMGDLVSEASARRRFQTTLLVAFAGIALLLALVGLYGLMAFSVNRRTREVGIRMALGADRLEVLFLILRNAVALIGCGLAAGLIFSWMILRVLRSFLFGVSEHDLPTVLMVCLLLVVCGLIAALIPARRAASINPVQALRTE
jgi:putative ABC transport system permease protein